MTGQLTLQLIRLDTDHPRTSVVGQLRMQMPKYPHLNISVNEVSAWKSNGISKNAIVE